jgi:hypothetical protein
MKEFPMATKQDDDDILTGAVPEPDAEPTAAERAHAKTFAELVDKTLAGKAPPAMSADDRALLEVATVIRAAAGNVELDATKRHSLVEAALRQAVGGKGASTSGGHAVIPIERGRARRWAPWAVAGTSMIVAAAALLLWLRTPPHLVVAPAAAALPETMRSRPTDPLIGPITQEHAGDASARIDTIFADRLDGYRELRMRGRKP